MRLTVILADVLSTVLNLFPRAHAALQVLITVHGHTMSALSLTKHRTWHQVCYLGSVRAIFALMAAFFPKTRDPRPRTPRAVFLPAVICAALAVATTIPLTGPEQHGKGDRSAAGISSQIGAQAASNAAFKPMRTAPRTRSQAKQEGLGTQDAAYIASQLHRRLRPRQPVSNRTGHHAAGLAGVRTGRSDVNSQYK